MARGRRRIRPLRPNEPHFTAELKGIDELERALLQLPKATGKNVLRGVLRKAAIPVAADAARRAPYDAAPDGPHLRDSIAVSSRLKRRQRQTRLRAGAVEVYVGPRVRHAHLVEFGTGPRYTKSGRYTGQVAPRPFMRPAWEAQKGRALEIVREELWKALLRTARRLRRQAQKLDIELRRR